MDNQEIQLHEEIKTLKQKYKYYFAVSIIAIIFALISVIVLYINIDKMTDESPTIKEIDLTTKEIEKIAVLLTKTKEIESQLDRLSWDFDLIQQLLKTPMYQKGLFDTSSLEGYVRVDSNHGIFFVSLIDIQPYLNGYKLILNIGNPSYVTYRGFDLTVEWGEFLLSETKQRKETYTKDLYPGSWNKIEFNISPVEAEELNYIKVSITTNRLSLHDR